MVGVFPAVHSSNEDILLSPAMGVNGGTPSPANQTMLTMSLGSADWQSVPLVSVPQADPAWNQAQGNTYEWGIYVQRATGSGANLTSYRCYYFIELHDRPELG